MEAQMIVGHSRESLKHLIREEIKEVVGMFPEANRTGEFGVAVMELLGKVLEGPSNTTIANCNFTGNYEPKKGKKK